MVRYSDRKRAIQQVEEFLTKLIIDGDGESELFDEYMEIWHMLQSCRYYNERNHIPKNHSIVRGIYNYPDRQFRDIVRMNKSSYTCKFDQGSSCFCK
jgi:hypothetical protein